MQAHLDWSSAAIARELGAGLIPAGAVFQNARELELFHPDGSHPSLAGSYLAACAAVEIPGVPREMAARLQTAAVRPVFAGEESLATGGTWTIRAEEPATQSTLPLESCAVEPGRLRFVVRTLFLTQETHEAIPDGDRLHGRVEQQRAAQ